MKKRKNIKIIFNVFLSFILILLFFCGDMQVFADNTYFLISNPMTSYYMYGSLSYYDYGDDEWVSGIGWTINPSSSDGPSNFDPMGSALFMVSCSTSRPGSSYQFVKLSYNGVELSTSSSSPTVISPGVTLNFLSYSSTRINYYISIPELAATPTPEPTPTPTPAPTPTPLPADYDDTQFWGRMNTMAEGGWSALTAAFNGIFNNTVLRNLVVYVPLFGAIIYLFVYLLFMGSD